VRGEEEAGGVERRAGSRGPRQAVTLEQLPHIGNIQGRIFKKSTQTRSWGTGGLLANGLMGVRRSSSTQNHPKAPLLK
jgi:hypothetical protein